MPPEPSRFMFSFAVVALSFGDRIGELDERSLAVNMFYYQPGAQRIFTELQGKTSLDFTGIGIFNGKS